MLEGLATEWGFGYWRRDREPGERRNWKEEHGSILPSQQSKVDSPQR